MTSLKEKAELFNFGWKPCGDRVMVLMADPVTVSGGVQIPDKFQQRPLEGLVLAVGPGLRDVNGHLWPIEAKIGDVIIYSKYAGTTIMVEKKEYLLLSEKDVLAIKDTSEETNVLVTRLSPSRVDSS